MASGDNVEAHHAAHCGMANSITLNYFTRAQALASVFHPLVPYMLGGRVFLAYEQFYYGILLRTLYTAEITYAKLSCCSSFVTSTSGLKYFSLASYPVLLCLGLT